MKKYSVADCFNVKNSPWPINYSPQKGDPDGFMPIFEKKEDAIEWNYGSEEYVVEIRPVENIGKKI